MSATTAHLAHRQVRALAHGLSALITCLLVTLAWLAPARAEGVTFEPRPCPQAVAAVADCHSTRDANGSYLLAAIPRNWNRGLVVFAHGGPRLDPPQDTDSDEDITRFAVMVREGYAWIGPSYRDGGFATRRAAADVESSRVAFITRFGEPRRTILHGQSWGAQVALKTLELHGRTPDGQSVYDAALLTNGVVASAARAYQFRVELRAIWQFYCRNHPAPEEAQYPLWMGLPVGATMTRADLNARIDACTGLDRAADRRTPEQRARLADILAASGVTEASLRQHMGWATFTLRSLIASTGGANPFDTRARVYSGVRDPRSLDAGVARFAPDPHAAALLDYDTRPTGQVITPILSLSSRDDPQVSPALQADLAATFAHAGRSGLLSQISLAWGDHSRLPEDALAVALEGLERWADAGQAPSWRTLLARCDARAAACAALREGSDLVAAQPVTSRPSPRPRRARQ